MDRVMKIFILSISPFIINLLGKDCKEAKIIRASQQSLPSENTFNPITASVKKISVCRSKDRKREIREYK
jgi:hypothetical protein